MQQEQVGPFNTTRLRSQAQALGSSAEGCGQFRRHDDQHAVDVAKWP